MNSTVNTRSVAAAVLCEVLADGRSLTAALDRGRSRLAPGKDRAFVQSLCYGTLRWYFRLDIILDQLLRKPFKEKDTDIRVLALLGLYQIAFTRVKPYAAVSETVAAVRGKAWAKSVLNGLLRTYQRNREEMDSVADALVVGRTAHPEWLVKELHHNWPDAAEQVLEANNQLPPMTLRVNRTKCSRDEYLQKLVLAGVFGAPLKWSPEAIGLEHPVDVEQLPEFQAGFVSVQDVAAQFAARLVDVRPGHRVLDACAAPGGKTSHILESNSSLEEMVAVDIDPARVARISQNLARLGLQATVVTGDVMNPGEWWDGRLFDRILLDVPCSATGVIRRHPDIKILRRPSDVETLSCTQRELLEMGWSMLAPGGMLVYSTCSVLPKENHEQIETFIGSHPDVREKSIEHGWGIKCSHGRQILPGESLMDGFYYACLLRTG